MRRMKAIWLAILITNITLASSNIIATLNDGTQTEFSAIEILFRGTYERMKSANYQLITIRITK
jgi:hypothetical protein